ncbi:MAG: hypothetical protein WDZ51_06100 [Pirellulaceae bacterium]
MNSFRIRCTTCSTKLKVKDASLVGHILSCPKCGSMVQVPDPAGPDPDNMLVRETSDSTTQRAPSASTKRPSAPPPIKFSESGSLFGEAAAMLSEPETSLEDSSQAAGESQSKPKADSPPPESATSPAPKLKTPSEKTPEPSAEISSSEPAESGESVLPLPESDQSPAKSSRKVAAAAVTAMVPPVPETAAEGSASPPEQSTPSQPIANEPAPIQPQAFAAEAGMGVWRIAAISGGVAAVASILVVVTLQAFMAGGSGQQVARNQDQVQPPSQPTVVESPDVPAQPNPPSTTEADPPGEPSRKVPPPESDPAPEESTENEPAKSEPIPSEEPEVESQTAEQPATGQQDNPFLFDSPAEPAANQTAEDPATEQPASEPQADADQESSPSMKFREDPLYDVFGESFPVFDNEMLEATASLPDLEPEAPLDAAGDQDQTTKMLPPIDVESRLADPVAAINFERIPLINFVRFVSRMTNMPISVSPEALDQADISTSTPVTVKLKGTSVEKMLASALIPHGLAVRTTTRGVRVDIPQTLNGQPRTTRLACDDLVSNDKELADLAYLLVNLVEPGSWKVAGGEGQYRLEEKTIIVSQHESALFSSILFLERLRVARGLTPRSSYAKRLFTLDTRHQQLAPKLKQNIAAQFVVPTPIDQLVEHLERQASVSILCDWESLATDGVSPESLASLSALQVPLEKALDDLCAEINVRWRPTSGGAIQLMGSQDYAQLPFLEFYPADKFAQNRPAAAALIKRAETKLEDLPRHKAGRILYDPKSGHFLARLTAGDHQRLVKFLQSQMP